MSFIRGSELIDRFRVSPSLARSHINNRLRSTSLLVSAVTPPRLQQ
jgi:hypothetical protein